MKTILLSFFLVLILAIGIFVATYEGFDIMSDKRTWIVALVTWQKAYIKNVASATPKQTLFNTIMTMDISLNRIDNLTKPPYNLTGSQISAIYASETAAMNNDLNSWGISSGAESADAKFLTDILTKPPYNLTGAQISAIYASENAAMNSWGISSPSSSPYDSSWGSGSSSSSAPASSGSSSAPASSGSSSGPASSSAPASSGSSSASGPGLLTPPADPTLQSPAADTISRSVETKAAASTESKSPSDWHRCPDMSQYIKKDEIPCWNCTL